MADNQLPEKVAPPSDGPESKTLCRAGSRRPVAFTGEQREFWVPDRKARIKSLHRRRHSHGWPFPRFDEGIAAMEGHAVDSLRNLGQRFPAIVGHWLKG